MDWSTLLDKGVVAIAPKLFDIAVSATSKSFQSIRPYATLRFDDHFAQTFQRCTKIKTIVNGDSPIDLLSSYTKLNFRNENKTLDDLNLIDEMWQSRRFVISGAAGSGKSMFMRYLWISCFVESRGKIPLFIELRRLNGVESTDLTTFLFYSCAFKQEKSAREIFDRAIDEGQFFIILDGFDELNPEKKNEVEKGILAFSQRGKNILVVSSREDERFSAWQAFSIYHVEPMSKTQIVTLIQRTDFDAVIKQKFLKEIRSGLYERHKDFISRPLLATMMLLTFNSFAEIPERIHVFYGQVFDTLFSRHDATKEAFRRVRHTNLSIEEFKRLFGMFCLLSYLEEKIEFMESDLVELIGKAAKAEAIDVNNNEFMLDVLQSVCLLQREGLYVIFSHRSFQEYFSAYSLIRLPNEQARIFAERFSVRTRDSVFVLLYEMNRSFFQDIYTLPLYNKYEAGLEEIETYGNVVESCRILGAVVIIQNRLMSVKKNKVKSRQGVAGLIQFMIGNSLGYYLYWLPKLYAGENYQLAYSSTENFEDAPLTGTPEYFNLEAGVLVRLEDQRVMFHHIKKSARNLSITELKVDAAELLNRWINESLAGKQMIQDAKQSAKTIRSLISRIRANNDQLTILAQYKK